MPGLIIKPRSRIFHGHEWIYGSEVKKVFGNPEPGSVITLKDFKDRALGTAIYNPKSQIVARRFSRRKQSLDADFFQRRIERAINYRKDMPGIDSQLCRLVWSESDGLPGVIVDRYGPHIVLQTLTLAMDQRIELIAEALVNLLNPDSITARNDSPSRVAEGMEPETRLLHGTEPEPFDLEHEGITYCIDLRSGQKTGLYLDQLSNYKQTARHAEGRRVLDCFTNQGGFALACAKAGAKEVIAIDSSAPALENARRNAEKSNLSNLEFVEDNVFDYLKARDSEEERYDLIILDPPSFTRNKHSLKDAMRGYKEIHLRALKMLDPGGILATFTCSHHVSREDFLQMLTSASVDAKRTLRQTDTFAQRSDHPVIATIPETEYLKGMAFEVIPSW